MLKMVFEIIKQMQDDQIGLISSMSVTNNKAIEVWGMGITSPTLTLSSVWEPRLPRLLLMSRLL